MFSLFSKPSEETAFIFDIGSGSVGGASVIFSRSGVPKIICSVRENIPFRKNLDPGRFAERMLNTLELVSARLQKEEPIRRNALRGKIKSPSRACIIFSSPWYFSKTESMSVKEKESFLVTIDLVSDMAKKEEEEFEAGIKSPDFGKFFGKDTVLLEKKIIDIRLNGYPVSYPYGKTAKEIESHFFISLAVGSILKKSKEIIFKRFHLRKIDAHSFSLASFVAIRDLFPESSDFLFLDISGEITEISVIKKGTLLETVSFPLGKNFLIRKMAESLGDEKGSLSESALSLYFGRRGSKDFMEKTGKVLKEAEEDWLSLFYDTISGFSGESFVPTLAYLVADEDAEKIFAEFLEHADLSRFSLVSGSFKVSLLDKEKLKKSCVFPDGMETDPFISLISVFGNRIFQD